VFGETTKRRLSKLKMYLSVNTTTIVQLY